MTSRRFAVLASGAGSNALALAAAARAGRIRAQLALVVSDDPAAPVLQRCAWAGIPALVVDACAHESRASYEAELVAALQRHGVDAIVLAGYMRICGPRFLAAFGGVTINVHPSMLPANPGRDAVGAVLAQRPRPLRTGVTVHFVDEGVDTGPVICQRPVALHEEDDRETLMGRIRPVEHLLLPLVTAGLVAGDIELRGDAVAIAPRMRHRLREAGALLPPSTPAAAQPRRHSHPDRVLEVSAP